MTSSSTEVAGEAPSGVQQIPKVGAWNVRHWTTAQLTRSLRMANMCNGAVLIATGILCFLVASVQISFASVTVSAYVVFFGLMLSCLECNMTALAPKFQRNFGFMYSFLGRSFFIFFAGTMAYALNNWLSWITGSLTLLNGMFNGYVICVHPAFKTGELTALGDPYGGYTGGETEMLDFLKKNPQLAASAGTAAANFARENPDVAASAMQGAAQQHSSSSSSSSSAGTAANPWGAK